MTMNRRRVVWPLLCAVLLAAPGSAQAAPSVTFASPVFKDDGNVVITGAVNANPGDCGAPANSGCWALLALEPPSGGLVRGSSQLFLNDNDSFFQTLSAVIPLQGMQAGSYTPFASLTNANNATTTSTGPAFRFPASDLQVSAPTLRREGGALTISYRVRDGGSLSGTKQQAKARTMLTLERVGRAQTSARKRFRTTLRSRPGRNREVLPYRITRRVRRGERYRVTVELRDRLKRRDRGTARARL